MIPLSTYGQIPSNEQTWILLPQIEPGNEYVMMLTRMGGTVRMLVVPQAVPPFWEQIWDETWQIILAVLGGGAAARHKDLIKNIVYLFDKRKTNGK